MGKTCCSVYYCGYAESLPDFCPQCQTPEVEFLGLGTEKVEELLNKLFPNAQIQRMDRDTTARKGALESIISRFGNREIDILLGTQMIAKGHDFPGGDPGGCIIGGSKHEFTVIFGALNAHSNC